MTLGAMWVRTYGEQSELVAISDSRLTGGKVWDQCPKVFPMARGDCVISFSGETDYAYPLVAHAINAIDAWDESRNRRLPLERLRGHLSRVFTSVLDGVDLDGLIGGPSGDPTVLLLGGYSWSTHRWIIWALRWDTAARAFSHSTLRARTPGQRGAIMWTGDWDAVGEAKRRLNIRLKASGHSLAREGLNMEPLEVLRDVIRSETYSSVGGPLQLAKVYRHLNSRLFMIPWARNGEIVRTLAGRYLLDYEEASRPASIDPDRPDSFVSLDPGRDADPRREED